MPAKKAPRWMAPALPVIAGKPAPTRDRTSFWILVSSQNVGAGDSAGLQIAMPCSARNVTKASSSSTFTPSSAALASLEPAPWPCHHAVGLARHRTGHLGAQAFQLVLGDVAAHALQRTRQHPSLAGQRQALGYLLLAAPMHAERQQLGFDVPRQLGFASSLKNSRTASACLAARAWRRSMPSAAMILSRLSSLATSFSAPVGPTEAMSSLASNPGQGGAGGEFGSQFAFVL